MFVDNLSVSLGFVNSGYGVNGIAHNAGPAPSPIGQMPPNDGMPGGPMPPAFFPITFINNLLMF
ncbi:hypothetical protein E2986_12296 [Frieseomelitta varia]|uniref:Uncharacterized protein n=1 Tax=Frieseomelitta varia TaxID=561572 RepID=A0A833RZW9_9HYME|nr:hypothetical protein E2986_12296 [Frieseomelitta varia]